MPVIVSSMRSRVAASQGVSTDSPAARAAATGSPGLPGTVCEWTPIFSSAFWPEILPPTTPMNPTMLVGSAKTTSPVDAMYMPPLAAMSPTLTTSFFLWRMAMSACQSRSLASALPPGESMRTTTAFTSSSCSSRESVRISRCSTMPSLPPRAPPLSIEIAPTASTSATGAAPSESPAMPRSRSEKPSLCPAAPAPSRTSARTAPVAASSPVRAWSK